MVPAAHVVLFAGAPVCSLQEYGEKGLTIKLTGGINFCVFIWKMS